MSLLPPEIDVEARAPIWDCMQLLYMDIDPNFELNGIAEICARSDYTLGDLEAILFNEVRPAVSFNLFMLPAPEWGGFEIDWLTKRVLKKHRFGKPLPTFFTKYTKEWWKELVPLIEDKREND